MGRYSYSSISTYEKCPRKYKYSYIDRLPRGEAGPAAQRGTELHAIIENYLLGKTVELHGPLAFYEGFLQELKELKPLPEHKFSINRDWELTDWDAPDAYLVGVLDLLLPLDEVKIWDWKTGRVYDEHANQRELYGISGFCMYPEKEVVHVEHTYLDLQQTEHSVFYRAELDNLKEKWRKKTDRIEADEVYPPNPNYGCRWCDFSKQNGGPCQF